MAGHGLRRSFRTIRAILRREFIDVLRDPRSLALTLMWPISMLMMYGYGIRYDVDNVPITILDYSETPDSRDLSEQMRRSGYFAVKSTMEFTAKVNRVELPGDYYTATDRWHVTLGDSDQDR